MRYRDCGSTAGGRAEYAAGVLNMPLAKQKPVSRSLNVRAPNRVTRTYKQRLNGSVSKVFPLLCPVREAEWIHGWNPVLVLTQSG